MSSDCNVNTLRSVVYSCEVLPLTVIDGQIIRPGKVDSQFIVSAHVLLWEILNISFFIISRDHHVVAQ